MIMTISMKKLQRKKQVVPVAQYVAHYRRGHRLGPRHGHLPSHQGRSLTLVTLL